MSWELEGQASMEVKAGQIYRPTNKTAAEDFLRDQKSISNSPTDCIYFPIASTASRQ